MAAVGIMPREVRLVILSVGLILAGVAGHRVPIRSSCATLRRRWPLPSAPSPCSSPSAIITVGATITTIQRILHVRSQAKQQSTQ